MSQFEFIFIIASIVAGLALARLFDGLGQTLQRKLSGKPVDVVHFLFSIFVFYLLLIVWWALYRWESETEWNFAKFLEIIVYMASFYALASNLYPRKADHVPKFEEIRAGFYIILATNLLLEILDHYMWGALLSPWYYLPTTGHMVALCIVGIFAKRRIVDLAIASWLLVIILVWPFLARFTI
jgi:hypothetical protein